MKQILLSILLSSALISFAQQAPKQQSKSEEFAAQSGVLIKREFEFIDGIKGAAVKVQRITDMVSSKTMLSLRFEYEYKSSYTTDTKIGVLDIDEVTTLLASVKIMQEKIFATAPTLYTEVYYKSRGGFECGAYYSSDKAVWSCYLKLEQFDSNSYVFMKAEDLTKLIAILESAKLKMQ